MCPGRCGCKLGVTTGMRRYVDGRMRVVTRRQNMARSERGRKEKKSSYPLPQILLVTVFGTQVANSVLKLEVGFKELDSERPRIGGRQWFDVTVQSNPYLPARDGSHMCNSYVGMYIPSCTSNLPPS